MYSVNTEYLSTSVSLLPLPATFTIIAGTFSALLSFPSSSQLLGSALKSSTQTLTATQAFKAQTALHLSRRGGGGGGERASVTRAFTAFKTFTAAEMRGWVMVNREHLRLEKRKSSLRTG